MKLCKSVHINGDFQNGFTVGVKMNGVMPTNIEERQELFRDSIDREYLIWEEKELKASISNVPVLVFYI